MTAYFVTQHAGALEWASEQSLQIDQICPHLDPTEVEPGDVVIGTLPVLLAAIVCARGARYYHLRLPLSATQRGAELSAEAMREAGARLERYHIEQLIESLPCIS